MHEDERLRRIARYRRKAAFFRTVNQFARAEELERRADELDPKPEVPVERHAPVRVTTAKPPAKRRPGRPRKVTA